MHRPEQLKILLVEDDQESMNLFVTCFYKEYNILCASSGEEALECFDREDNIAMVLSDQAMPGMTGVELLTHIYQQDESVIRIIITGFLNTRDIIAAINKGHIYQFILKPWEVVQMRMVLAQASYIWRLRRENVALHEQVVEQNALLTQANERLQSSKRPCVTFRFRSLLHERKSSAVLLWSFMMNSGNPWLRSRCRPESWKMIFLLRGKNSRRK